ncbi:hypothetical protein ES703_115936 [subsurface metagenome]
MIFTARMKQLVAVVLDHDADKVTKELLRQGVLHFVNITELAGEWNKKVDAMTPQISGALIAELRKRIESFLSLLGYRPGAGKDLEVENLKAVDLEESTKILDRVAARLQGIRERQRNLQQEILKLEDIGRQLELFGDLGAGISTRSQYSFLNIQTSSISTAP